MVPPFEKDAWNVTNPKLKSVLTVGDLGNNEFYPLGITTEQAMKMNFVLRELNIGDFGVYARHFDDTQADLFFPDDERYLPGYPGVNIFTAFGPQTFGLCIGYIRDFINLSGLHFPDGNQTIIPCQGQVTPPFDCVASGSAPDKTNRLYFQSAAIFNAERVFPFVNFAYPIPFPFPGAITNYGQWELFGPNDGMVATGHSLHLFDWGSMPLYFYYDTFFYDPVTDPPQLDHDIYITAASYFPYDDSVLGPKWDTATGASRRGAAYN